MISEIFHLTYKTYHFTIVIAESMKRECYEVLDKGQIRTKDDD